MTRIILLRHGQSEANRDIWFAGHSDPHLTEKGLLQAECAAEYLARHERIDLILASDLHRAVEREVDRNGIANGLGTVCNGFGIDDTDQTAVHIEQTAARVTGIDRRIGLE